MSTETASPVKLDELVCFALYTASRAVTNSYRPLLDEVGLTYPQYLALLALWERGPQSVKELSTALRLDSGTLSPLLKRLESSGYVSRRRLASDERSVLVSLTDAGRALETAARDIPRRAACTVDLPVTDLARLRASLIQFTDAVDAAMTPAPDLASEPAGKPTRQGES